MPHPFPPSFLEAARYFRSRQDLFRKKWAREPALAVANLATGGLVVPFINEPRLKAPNDKVTVTKVSLFRLFEYNYDILILILLVY